MIVHRKSQISNTSDFDTRFQLGNKRMNFFSHFFDLGILIMIVQFSAEVAETNKRKKWTIYLKLCIDSHCAIVSLGAKEKKNQSKKSNIRSLFSEFAETKIIVWTRNTHNFKYIFSPYFKHKTIFFQFFFNRTFYIWPKKAANKKKLIPRSASKLIG